MATFKILDTFTITNRGFVIIGDITDDGIIRVGDSASIPTDNDSIDIQIRGVEMVDKISERIAHVGLVVSFNDQAKIKDLKLNGLEIKTIIK